MPKQKDNACSPILQDEHIWWLIDRLHVDPYITVESLHRELSEFFQFPCHVSISCVSKAVGSPVGFTLKLMQYEPYDYNNEECIEST